MDKLKKTDNDLTFNRVKLINFKITDNIFFLGLNELIFLPWFGFGKHKYFEKL